MAKVCSLYTLELVQLQLASRRLARQRFIGGFVAVMRHDPRAVNPVVSISSAELCAMVWTALPVCTHKRACHVVPGDRYRPP